MTNNNNDDTMDRKLELVAVPVSDVDRAKAFYTRMGFNPDHDHTVNPELRFVKLTPARLRLLNRHRTGHHDRGARLSDGSPACRR